LEFIDLPSSPDNAGVVTVARAFFRAEEVNREPGNNEGRTVPTRSEADPILWTKMGFI
jgi:hypothetical protein